MKLDNNNHSVFLMYYHLVLVIKYRRKVVDDVVSDRLKEIFSTFLQITTSPCRNGTMTQTTFIFCSKVSPTANCQNSSMPIKVLLQDL